MYDYLIVGAGLFGSTFAYEMGRYGYSCLVIDKKSHIGGTCYTEELYGINVHLYGAHIFRTDDKELWDYVNQFAEFNRFTNSPVANYNGKIYSLPFNMNTFYQIYGANTPEQAMRCLENDTIDNRHPKNLEEYCLSTIGRKAYEILVKSYTEKQWRRKCSELPPDIMPLPIRFTYSNEYFNERYQGIPIGGYTQIFHKMLEYADVKLGQDFFKKREAYEQTALKILFTGKIDDYYGRCFGALEYRSLHFEHEVHNVENVTGNAVINYTGSREKYTRTIEHKHFENTNSPFSVVSYEFPLPHTDHNYPYYPINTARNNELYQRYKKLSKGDPKTIFGGRLGTYSFDNMAKSITAARSLAEKERSLHE